MLAGLLYDDCFISYKMRSFYQFSQWLINKMIDMRLNSMKMRKEQRYKFLLFTQNTCMVVIVNNGNDRGCQYRAL